MDYPSSEAARLHPTTGKFTDGEPGQSIPPSIDSAEYQNTVYDELLRVIIAAGIDPDESKTDQLLASINKLINDNSIAFDNIENTNPTFNVTGAAIEQSWLNRATGELFICVRADENDNKWVGQLGTIIEQWNPDNDPNLFIHYTFDNVVGNTVIDERGNVDATIVGTVPVAPGQEGNALSFGATGAYVDTGYKPPAGDYSISLWARRDDTLTDDMIVSTITATHDSTGPAIYFRDNEDSLHFGHYQNINGAADIITSPTDSSNLINIVAVHENGVANRIYIDGVIVGSIACADTQGTATYTMKIGAKADRVGAEMWFNGDIDNFRFFNRVLTADEIATIYSREQVA